MSESPDSDEPEACKIARHVLRRYFISGVVEYGPDIAPLELSRPAPVFVSLWSGDHLRGCMGTLRPLMPTASREIGFAALQAATADPLRRPLHPAELEALTIGVAVFGERRVLDPREEPAAGEALEVEDARGRAALVLPGCGGEEEALEAAGIPFGELVARTAVVVVPYGRQPP